MRSEKTLYELLGEATFVEIVAAFYRRVAEDPVLRPMYPEHDLEGAARRLRLFLIQYFGGPTVYAEERGHPRLRARHVNYSIDRRARDAWIHNMVAALDEVRIPEPAYSQMRAYFENAATFMINQPLGGMLKD